MLHQPNASDAGQGLFCCHLPQAGQKTSVSPSVGAAAEGETLFCILLLRIAEGRRRPVPLGGTQRAISRSRAAAAADGQEGAAADLPQGEAGIVGIPLTQQGQVEGGGILAAHHRQGANALRHLLAQVADGFPAPSQCPRVRPASAPIPPDGR